MQDILSLEPFSLESKNFAERKLKMRYSTFDVTVHSMNQHISPCSLGNLHGNKEH
jgi:hypothetical protein